MPLNSKRQEEMFLEVKEHLDRLRIPNSFPLQATPLLHQLLTQHIHKLSPQFSTSKSNQVPNADDALRRTVAKMQKENNQLHHKIMLKHEETQNLKHLLEQASTTKGFGTRPYEIMLKKSQSQIETLQEELNQVKFKYNELMELIHQDSKIQKTYLKRLLKHRNLQITSVAKEEPLPTQQTTNNLQELKTRIQLLRQKVYIRDQEIFRLQKLSEGINMEAILNDYIRTNQKENRQNNQIQLNTLLQQNQKLKAQLNDLKKKGGAKQALKEEGMKKEEKLRKVGSQNSLLKRKIKESDFNTEHTFKLDQKQIAFAKKKSAQAKAKIAELQKKVQRLQSQIIFLKKQNHQLMNNASNEDLNKIGENQPAKQREIRKSAELNLMQCKEKIKSMAESALALKAQIRLKNQSILNLEKIVAEFTKLSGKHSQSEECSRIEDDIEKRKQIAQLKQQLVYAKNTNFQCKSEVEQLRIQKQTLDEKVKNLKEMLTIKQQIYGEKNKNEQHLELQSQIEDLKLQLKRQEHKVLNLNTLNKELRETFQEFKLNMQNQAGSKEASQIKLMGKVKELELKLEEWQIESHLKENKSEHYRSNIKQLESINEELQAKLKAMTEENSKFTRENNQLSQKLKKLEILHGDTQQRLEATKQQVILLESLKNNQEPRDMILISKYDSLVLQCQDLEDALRIARETANREEIQRMRVARENDKLNLHLAQLERALALQSEEMKIYYRKYVGQNQ